MDFAVLRTVFRNSHQDTLSVGTDHGELHKISRIEEDIRTFLVRIYPLHLTATHVRPVHNRLARGERTFIEVAHDSAQKTVVAGRDAVVVVKGYAGDSVDEDPVLI